MPFYYIHKITVTVRCDKDHGWMSNSDLMEASLADLMCSQEILGFFFYCPLAAFSTFIAQRWRE